MALVRGILLHKVVLCFGRRWLCLYPSLFLVGFAFLGLDDELYLVFHFPALDIIVLGKGGKAAHQMPAFLAPVVSQRLVPRFASLIV